MRNQLSPSILAADFTKLGDQVRAVEEAGAGYLHIDVMDGQFVPSISFGMPVIASLRGMSRLVFDVHLMIEEPERYIEEFARLGADIITVHAEACTHLDRVLHQIHETGKKAGVALNPATDLSVLEYVLDQVDMILIMTVNPGFGGQNYISYCTEKIRRLRRILTERGLETDIQVDGGINEKTLPVVLEAGANVIVAGSSVFREDPAKGVRKFLEIMGLREEREEG
ncbi:MAG: ribulose-phosphate 3-epimerase [Candidatus Limivivens sp.]|nr:ribulose-phosphate 3-epimerase [Candidatus Limivivens sp.]